LLVAGRAFGPLPAEVAPPQHLAEVGGRHRHPPRLGQPRRHLPQRPGAGAAGRVGIQPLLDGQQVRLAEAGRPAGAGAVRQAGDPLGGEALDELAHRLVVVAERAGRFGHGSAVGDGGDHPQALVDGMRGRAGPQPTVEVGAFGRRQDNAERGLHGGASFRAP
jgi:hypothetical protein